MSGARRRNVRCKACGPCLADDCGVCVYCLDKPKFGGPNKKRCACVKRKCVNMTSSRSSLVPEAASVTLEDVPVDVVGHALDNVNNQDAEKEPHPLISISIPMPVISEEPMAIIENVTLKRKRVDTGPPQPLSVGVDNDCDNAKTDEGTSNNDHLQHDHRYSNHISYFTSPLPMETMSQDASKDSGEDSSSSASSPDYSSLPSKDFSYDEDDLTCKEVMETEEEMDRRNLADRNHRESEPLICKKEKSEPYLDELLKLNDTASLLNAIDDDIEKLMQEEEPENSDFDEDARDNDDDQYSFFPVSVKKESTEIDANVGNTLEVRLLKKTNSKSSVRVKAEPRTP